MPIEPTYIRLDFEAILDGLGPDHFVHEFIVIKKRGVWLKYPRCGDSLTWHPLNEIDEPGSPNPLTAPVLPFPFTARMLAALLIDGPGTFIRMRYGPWDEGPDSEALAHLAPLAVKARDALSGAFDAYRQAAALAPSPKADEDDVRVEGAARRKFIVRGLLRPLPTGIDDADVQGAMRPLGDSPSIASTAAQALSASQLADPAPPLAVGGGELHRQTGETW